MPGRDASRPRLMRRLTSRNISGNSRASELKKALGQDGERSISARQFGKRVSVKCGTPPSRACCSATRSTSRAASAAGAASTRASRRTTSRAIRRCTGSGCSQMEKEHGVDFAHADAYYDARAGAAGGSLLRAGRVPAVPEPAVHQGVPDRRDLDRAGRHRGHRLRLVHRLPLLHGRLPVRRAPLQLGRANDSVRSKSIQNMHYLGNRPRPRGVVEKCTFCIQRVRGRAATRPASRSARSARASSATCSIPTARSATSSRHKRVLRPQGGAEHHAEVLLLLRDVRPVTFLRRFARS